MEGLLERVADAILADDRREAMAHLKDLLVDNAQVLRVEIAFQTLRFASLPCRLTTRD